MQTNECGKRWIHSLRLSFGPLQLQSNCLEEYAAAPSDAPVTLPIFAERVQALMRQAVSEGCTRRELDQILRQLGSGGSNVDA